MKGRFLFRCGVLRFSSRSHHFKRFLQVLLHSHLAIFRCQLNALSGTLAEQEIPCFLQIFNAKLLKYVFGLS